MEQMSISFKGVFCSLIFILRSMPLIMQTTFCCALPNTIDLARRGQSHTDVYRQMCIDSPYALHPFTLIIPGNSRSPETESGGYPGVGCCLAGNGRWVCEDCFGKRLLQCLLSYLLN